MRNWPRYSLPGAVALALVIAALAVADMALDTAKAQAPSTIDTISIDMGGTGTNVGVNDNGIPALVDADFSGAVDPETGAQCTGGGIGVDDDADTFVDDGCVVTLSAQEPCAEITNDNLLNSDEDTIQFGVPPTGAVGSDKVFFDITVGQQPGSSPGAPGGIPAGRPITQTNLRINWSPDVLDVNPVGGGGDPAAASVNSDLLMASAGGYAPSTPVSIITQTGNLLITRGDGGLTETGAGVLLRVGLEGVAAGVADLTLTDVDIRDDQNILIPVDTVNNASVAVDSPCPLSADISVTSATTTAPASGTVATPFDVTVDAGLSNSAAGAVNTDISVTLNMPPDCSNGTNPHLINDLALPAGASAMAQQTFSVTCTNPSNHDFTATVVATEDDAGVVESNPLNNSAISLADTTAVSGTADLSVQSVTVTPPASGTVGVSFDVTVSGVVGNTASFPVTADATVSLSQDPAVGPGNDCVFLPVGDQVINNATILASPNTTTLATQTWGVICTTKSDHGFIGTVSIAEDDIHVTDANAQNDSNTGQGTAPVLADADLKVASVTVTAPVEADANTNFDVTVDAVLHNNGPYGPVDGDVDATLNLPADCTADAASVAETIALPVSADTDMTTATFSVSCTDPSNHVFSADVSVAVSAQEVHVTDSDDTNNLASAESTTAVSASTDIKVMSVTLSVPNSAANGTPFDATVNATLHNNGPFTPVVVDATITLTLPAGCTADPAGTQVEQNISLIAAEDKAMPEKTWAVTCTQNGVSSFSAKVALGIDQEHVSDSDTASDIKSSTTVDVAIGASSLPPTGGEPGDGALAFPMYLLGIGMAAVAAASALGYGIWRRRQTAA